MSLTCFAAAWDQEGVGDALLGGGQWLEPPPGYPPAARDKQRVAEWLAVHRNWEAVQGAEISGVGSSPSSATVVFEGDLLPFMLPGDATFEDLANRLDHINSRNSGTVVAIKVKFGSSPEGWPSRG